MNSVESCPGRGPHPTPVGQDVKPGRWMAIRIVARTVDYVQSCYPAVLERRLSIGSSAIAREEIDRPVWKA